jgi:hypothetical protein
MNEDSTVDTYLKTKDFVKQENSWVKKHIEHSTSVIEALHQSGCLHTQMPFLFTWQETYNMTLYATLHIHVILVKTRHYAAGRK